MVVPFTNGRISRSMVRVPGSGVDENASPTCLNLGNVSNFAAMIPVPQTLSFNNQKGLPQLKSSFTFSDKSKLSPMTVQNREGDRRPTSQLTDETVKLDGFTDSPRPINDSSDITQAMNSTVVRSSEVLVSAHVTTPSGDKNTSRSSRLKRPLREESREESEVPSPPKRHRIISTSPLNKPHVSSPPTLPHVRSPLTLPHVSSPPTLPKETSKINWVIPSGIWGANGNIQSVPIVLPIAGTSNMPFSTPVVLPNGSATGKALPAFVLQASGRNTSAVGTPQVTSLQSAPILMLPAQTLPVLFSSVPNRDLQHMSQERNQLKKENEALKYRLSLFHQLLRNKEKLMTVLRNLDAAQS